MRRKISAALAVMIIAAVTLFCVPAGAVGGTTGDVDVIFLVDSSRSMVRSDPDFIRLEAIKLFSDLCSLGSTKVGFVLFGSEINYAQPPAPIDTEADRENIRNIVSGLTETSGQTDIGKAVKYAVEMLAGDGYSGKGKFIVFLSDGRTVITNSKSGRTAEDSRKDLDDGIKMAQEAGISIFTIGLNSADSVDEEELNRISAETYADPTYMTDKATELSYILSNIYVRHTGAESYGICEYTSDGEYRDIPVTIDDSYVTEANVVIMHSKQPEDIQILDGSGAPVAADGTKAVLSVGDRYSLIKLYTPGVGEHHISIKAPKGADIGVNCILTRNYYLDVTLLTDKAIGKDTALKFSAAVKNAGGEQVTDAAFLGKLTAKAAVTNSETGSVKEVLLRNENGVFKGEMTLDENGSFTSQVSLYSENISIRSDIKILEAGSEVYKEPESPVKIILICAGSVIAVIAIIVLIARKIGSNVKMWSGRLTVSGNTGGMPAPPAIFDFAKKVPGKRKITLFDVLKGSFDESRADKLIPRKLAESVSITMSRTGNIRISQVKDITYSGGTVSGKKTVIGSGSRATLRYTDKSAGTNNVVIIQYMRT